MTGKRASLNLPTRRTKAKATAKRCQEYRQRAAQEPQEAPQTPQADKHPPEPQNRPQGQPQGRQEPQESQHGQQARATPQGSNKSYTRAFTGASIRAMEGEGNERKFLLSFSSEEPYDRGWCVEILDHSPGCVDLTRLNDIGVLLFNHKRDEVLGKINRAWIDGARGYAEVEFDTDADAETIYQKVKSGTLKGVSVGYRIGAIEEVMPGKTSTDGRFIGPCDVARKWEPFEISIVSIPADPTVGVGREYDPEETRKHAPSLRERQLQINLNKLF